MTWRTDNDPDPERAQIIADGVRAYDDAREVARQRRLPHNLVEAACSQAIGTAVGQGEAARGAKQRS